MEAMADLTGQTSILKRTGDSQPDELEVAAAVTAIWKYMQRNAEETNSLDPSCSDTGTGAWQKAARLEGAGLFKIREPLFRFRSKSRSLWPASLSISLYLAILLIFIGPPAPSLAQGLNAMPTSTIDNNNQVFTDETRRTTLRIGLAMNCAHADVVAVDGAEIRSADSGALVASLPANSQWSVSLAHSGADFQLTFRSLKNGDVANVVASGTRFSGSAYRNVAFIHPSAPPIARILALPFYSVNESTGFSPGNYQNGYLITPAGVDSAGVIQINGKLYRGSFWLRPVSSLKGPDGQSLALAFHVINVIDLEDYLLSVVPSEMPSSWQRR